MRTMYIECNMGAAGDMLTAALLELLPDKEEFVRRFNALGLPGVEMQISRTEKAGIFGTYCRVKLDGEEEHVADIPLGHAHHHDHDHDHDHVHDHAHDHHHDHDHTHDHIHDNHHDHDHHHGHSHNHGHHVHRRLADILKIVDAIELPQTVRNDFSQVYALIAEAESKAHNQPIEQIHFHEVGMLDAVADILAVCLLMDELAPDKIIVSPIHVGRGQVKCAHGVLPVPVPAVEYILRGVPTYQGEIEGELCTPTGAALLRHFATAFGPKPLMSVDHVGYGMGTKDFPVANMVRIFLGSEEKETADVFAEKYRDQVVEIKCNLDDMTGEELSFAVELLLAEGALDAYTQVIYMKKGRPAYLLTCLAKPEDVARLSYMMLKHTSTFGVRTSTFERTVLERKFKPINTKYGELNMKIGRLDDVSKEKFEHEDLVAIALEQGISLRELKNALYLALYGGSNSCEE